MSTKITRAAVDALCDRTTEALDQLPYAKSFEDWQTRMNAVGLNKFRNIETAEQFDLATTLIEELEHQNACAAAVRQQNLAAAAARAAHYRLFPLIGDGSTNDIHPGAPRGNSV